MSSLLGEGEGGWEGGRERGGGGRRYNSNLYLYIILDTLRLNLHIIM